MKTLPVDWTLKMVPYSKYNEVWKNFLLIVLKNIDLSDEHSLYSRQIQDDFAPDLIAIRLSKSYFR